MAEPVEWTPEETRSVWAALRAQLGVMPNDPLMPPDALAARRDLESAFRKLNTRIAGPGMAPIRRAPRARGVD